MRPTWGKGPLAELRRRRRGRRARSNAAAATGPGGNAPLLPGPAPRGHIPFTRRAKKSLELSLREATALHDNYIGVQHLILALLAPEDGTVPVILSALGAPATSLRRHPRPLPQGELTRANPAAIAREPPKKGPASLGSHRRTLNIMC